MPADAHFNDLCKQTSSSLSAARVSHQALDKNPAKAEREKEKKINQYVYVYMYVYIYSV